MGSVLMVEEISARKPPWQNPYVERVVGSIRRECTDHVIALGERHLARVLSRYASYYSGSLTHLSLMGNSPVPRAVEDGHSPPWISSHCASMVLDVLGSTPTLSPWPPRRPDQLLVASSWMLGRES